MRHCGSQRTRSVSRRLLIDVVMLTTAALAVAGTDAATEPEATSLPFGSPQVVRDLHYGDVLFHFYQGDWFNALVRLDAAQRLGRIRHHEDEGELLKGGLYLSLGQHEEAGRIFERLLARGAPGQVRDRAWFYLAKVWYQRGYLDRALRAIESVEGDLPAELAVERPVLAAQILMQLGRYDDAERLLAGWEGPPDWAAYARFNLGVALVRQARLEAAVRVLDQVGRMDAGTEELRALRDKANLAIGFAQLGANEPQAARLVLSRVRLDGPQSNKALLGAGWADAELDRPQRALVPWLELRRRNLLDAAVQESYLAIPYAYAQLAADSQAAEHYSIAIQAYGEEATRIDESIAAIRAGALLDTILAHDPQDELGWHWQLATLPDAPESRYLYHLLATHEFQEGLKNYRDLRLMQRNLARWALSIAAFDDMLETRRTAYAERLPRIEAVLDTVDLEDLERRRTEFAAELEAIERGGDAASLGTPREQALLARASALEQRLAIHDASEPMIAEMRAKTRLAKGVLLWEMSAARKARLWRSRRSLQELETALKDARRRWVHVERARGEMPARTGEFAIRVAALEPRISVLSTRLAAASAAQSRYLADVAVRELVAQKERLAAYSLQAQYALASIYDRASSATAGTVP